MTAREMKEIRSYNRYENIRKLCIRNRYFTCGTNDQYSKMFDMTETDQFTARDVAIAIWECSDSMADFSKILQEVKAIYTEAEAIIHRLVLEESKEEKETIDAEEAEYLERQHGIEIAYCL